MTASKETIKNEDQFHDAVQTIGAFYGITGLQIEVKPGAGTGCLPSKDGGLKVQVDPLQIARNGLAGEDASLEEMNIRQADALYLAGEQVARVRDIINGGIPRTTNKKDQFFWHAVSDTAIGAQLRRIPLLDSVTDEMYQEFRFPEGSLQNNPKHVQFMEAVLLKTVVPNGDWRFDSEIEEIINMLKDYPLGRQHVDVLEAMSHHETSVDTRLKIANQILRPIFERLFQEDVEQGRSNSQDSEDSENGEGDGNVSQRQKGSQQENNQQNQSDSDGNKDTQDSSDGDKGSQGGDDGKEQGQGQDQAGDNGQSGRQDKNQSGGDSSQFSNSYDQYEMAMRGGVNEDQLGDGQDNDQHGKMSKEMRELLRSMGFDPGDEYDDEDFLSADELDNHDGDMQQGRQTGDSESSDSSDSEDLESQMAGTIQQEMNLNKTDAYKYLGVLNKYRHVISETADILLKLSNIAESTTSPRYKTIADEKGRRIHPGRIMQAMTQLETKRAQPIWQPLENANIRSEFVFGGLDITLVVDVSTSMSGSKGDHAGAIAVILLEAIELAAQRAEEQQHQNTPPDVRSRVIAFGSGTQELSKMQHKARPVDKGRTFKNLIHPNSNSTLVAGSLEQVSKTAAATPSRDHIVFIITDAIFGDLEKARTIAKSIPENILLTQFEINSVANYSMNEKAITPYNQVIKNPEDLPGAVLHVIWDYVEHIDEL